MAEIIAGLYAAETAVEGAVAAYFITTATLPLKASLKHVTSSIPVSRQRHSMTVIGTQALIFGGEELDGTDDTNAGARLASNDVKILSLSADDGVAASVESVPARAVDESEKAPVARKGASGVAARNRMFVLGGEDADGKVLDEQGKLWVFDPSPRAWLVLEPPPSTEYPAARTNHQSVVSDDENVVFVHGGEGADGKILGDTWAFHLDHGKWTKLADTPWPATSGTSLAYADSRLWLFGSFPSPSENDSPESRLACLGIPELVPFKQGTLEPTSKSAATHWIVLPNPSAPKTESTLTKDDSASTSTSTTETAAAPEQAKAVLPPPRQNALLHAISTGQGRHYLLLSMGQSTTTASSHPPTLWAFQLPSAATTGAGVKDWIRQRLPGTKDFQGQWAEVEIEGVEVAGGEKGEKWSGRGWSAGAKVGGKQVLVWGGRGEEGGGRTGDGWVVKIV